MVFHAELIYIVYKADYDCVFEMVQSFFCRCRYSRGNAVGKGGDVLVLPQRAPMRFVRTAVTAT